MNTDHPQPIRFLLSPRPLVPPPALVTLTCLLLPASCPLSPGFAQTERQTKLLIPKMVPEVKPDLVPRLGHLGDVVGLCFSPDGRRLASSSRRTLLWNLQTGVPEMTLEGGGPLAFSDEGRTLASPSVLWDLEAREVKRAAPVPWEPTAIRAGSAVSPDARWRARRMVGRDKPGNQGAPRDWIEVSETRSGRLRTTLDLSGVVPRGATPLGPLQFSPDGAKLACAPFISREGSTCPILLLDLTTGQVERKLRGHAGLVHAVAFAPGADRLASVSFQTLAVWNLQTGAAELTRQMRYRRLTSVAFAPDGRTLVVGCSGGHLLVVDASTGARTTTVRLPVEADVRRLHFGPQGRELAAGSLSHVFVLDTETWAVESRFWGFARPFHEVAFSGGERRLVTYGMQGALVWDLNAGSAVALNGVRPPLCVTSDGLTWAYAVKNNVHLGHFDTGQSTVLKADAPVRQLVFSPDRQYLCAGTMQGQVTLWEQETGRQVHYRQVHDAPVTFLRFSPTGGLIAAGANRRMETPTGYAWRSKIVILDLETGTAPHQPDDCEGELTACAFSPDGGRLAWASSLRSEKRDEATEATVTVWDVAGGKPVNVLRGHTDRVVSVAFSADGQRLVTASREGTIAHWEVTGGRTEHVVSGLRLERGALGPHGRTFASLQPNGSVRLLDTEAGDEVATLFGLELRRTSVLDSRLSWLAVTPDGYFDCSIGGEEALLWRLGDAHYPFDQYAAKYRRPEIVRAALTGQSTADLTPLDGSQVPPRLAIRRPAYGETVEGTTLRVEVDTAGAHPIARLELLINGRPLTQGLARRLVVAEPEDKRKTFEFSLSLPAAGPLVRLQAAVYDNEGLRSPIAETVVRRSNAAYEKGGLYLLSVGVSEYRQPEARLGFAAADAAAFARTLERKQRGGWRQINSRVLTDDEATVPNLKFGLRWLKDEATENDVAVVFLAGHGVTDADGNYYFGAHEMDRLDPQNTCLNWNDFVSFLRECRAKQVAVWADTCHAGSVTGAGELDQLVDRLNRRAGVLVFAASRGDEPSAERDDWGHGAFTKAFIEAMDGKADVDPADGKVTVAELRDYVVDRVGKLTHGRQHPYMPRLQDFDPDWIMAVLGQRDRTIPPQRSGRRTALGGTLLASAPARLQPVLTGLATANYHANSLSMVLQRLLGDAEIPYRLASPEVDRARVTIRAARQPLATVLNLVFDSAGVMAAWEGDTLVVRPGG